MLKIFGLVGIFLFVFCIGLYGDEASYFDSTKAPETPKKQEPVQTAPDPALTMMSKFPWNLEKNFVALFTLHNLRLTIYGASAAAVSHAWDDNIEDYFSVRRTNNPFAQVGATMGEAYTLIPAISAMLIIGQKSHSTRFRSFTYALAQGYVLDAGLTLGLKAATRRQRPDLSNRESFPSGHSSDFFMIATAMNEYYGPKAGIIGYSLATYVAASRLKKNVHWLSDTVAGATLGYIVSRTIYHRTGGKNAPPKVAWTPQIDPFGKAVGVNFIIHIP